MFTIIVFSPVLSKRVSVEGMKVCESIGFILLEMAGKKKAETD